MRKKTQYIVVNEIYKTIYCGYPQKRAWKIITGSSGGMLLTDNKEAAEKVRNLLRIYSSRRARISVANAEKTPKKGVIRPSQIKL